MRTVLYLLKLRSYAHREDKYVLVCRNLHTLCIIVYVVRQPSGAFGHSQQCVVETDPLDVWQNKDDRSPVK